MMKKFKYLALMSAIALTSAIGFTACSSSDEATADVNPTYDGTSVRTDFAFNITKASQGTTRMSATNVQEDGTSFRGMQDMFLYAMNVEPNGGNALQNYALQSIAANGIGNSEETPSSKVYPLSIPVGTNNFLFYARALQANETNFQIGKVTFNNLQQGTLNTSNISFSLAPIEKPASITPDRATVETAFKKFLNEIRTIFLLIILLFYFK